MELLGANGWVYEYRNTSYDTTRGGSTELLLHTYIHTDIQTYRHTYTESFT